MAPYVTCTNTVGSRECGACQAGDDFSIAQDILVIHLDIIICLKKSFKMVILKNIAPNLRTTYVCLDTFIARLRREGV